MSSPDTAVAARPSDRPTAPPIGRPDGRPTGRPSGRPAVTVEEADGEIWGRARAMATDVTVRVRAVAATGAVRNALAVFAAVERACTRFDPTSPLMQLNSHPESWHPVPPECFRALVEAHRAYCRTRGRFDPRVLSDLLDLGYDRTLPFGRTEVSTGGGDGRARRKRASPPAWRPSFRGATRDVRLGGAPVDLGGIGKGLAVRWAGEMLAAVAPDHLVEAGGDCHCAGSAPDGEPWRVGVEDPLGDSDPVAVLAVRDRAVTTSSIRLRRWRAGGRTVHHLIDPRTGQSGGDGLLAVTVVGTDAAMSEVWSKVLFLEGRAGVAGLAARRGLAALWVTSSGEVLTSRAIDRYVLWRRS